MQQEFPARRAKTGSVLEMSWVLQGGPCGRAEDGSSRAVGEGVEEAAGGETSMDTAGHAKDIAFIKGDMENARECREKK